MMYNTHTPTKRTSGRYGDTVFTLRRIRNRVDPDPAIKRKRKQGWIRREQSRNCRKAMKTNSIIDIREAKGKTGKEP